MYLLRRAAMLIAQLDTSVVNLATRPIGAEFNAPVSALQWVIDGYNLTYAVLLSYAWQDDLLKRVYEGEAPGPVCSSTTWNKASISAGIRRGLPVVRST